MDIKILLRPWALSDAKSLTENANNKNVSDNLRDTFPFPYTMEHAIAFIEMTFSQKRKDIYWAIEIKGEAIGGIGGHFQEDIYRKNAEIGYWLGQTYWNKGIITYCIKEMTQYLFLNFDIERIYAEVYSNNIGSGKALEKAGFKNEAILRRNAFKNNTFLDTYVYAILRKNINNF